MKVQIKQFDVEMNLKNNGIEIDVSKNDGHLGDLYVTKTQLIWCKGKTNRSNGKKIYWEVLIGYMEQR